MGHLNATWSLSTHVGIDQCNLRVTEAAEMLSMQEGLWMAAGFVRTADFI